jgi:hypothetical protein
LDFFFTQTFPMRSTRSATKRKADAEGHVQEKNTKQPRTLGEVMALEREKASETLETNKKVSKYEMFKNYTKDEVINEFNATEPKPKEISFFASLFGKKINLNSQVYVAEVGGTRLNMYFLTLGTGKKPSTFTHMCNAEKITWNVSDLNLDHTTFSALELTTNAGMVFVRGQHVKGTTYDEYKYMGLLGTQATTISNNVVCVKFVIDMKITRKELAEQMGENVLKCKKNRWGATLCL